MASYNYGNTARKDYIYGNTVRKRQEEEKRIQQEKQRRAEAARKNRLAAKRMNFKNVLVLSFAVGISLLMCVGYLTLQSNATQNLKQIANMKSTLNNLENSNDTRYNSIVTGIDMMAMKEIAISQLGMAYPTPEQVIKFDRIDRQNYMDVYADPTDFE
jgi:hypothetical protein